MKKMSMSRARMIACLVCLVVCWSGPAAAQLWRSQLAEKSLLTIEKSIEISADETVVYTPLPADLSTVLGRDVVDYESFTVAYLPDVEAVEVARLAEAGGLRLRLEAGAAADQLFRGRAFGDLEARRQDWQTSDLEPRPVSGLFLFRFAYPVKSEWVSELERCGVSSLTALEAGTFLARADSADVIRACSVGRYLAWIDNFRTIDRADPAVLAAAADSSFWLEHLAGTELEEARRQLPASTIVLGSHRSSQTDRLFVWVAPGHEDLLRILDSSPSLVALVPHQEAELSDERQAQIVAGNHNGTKVAAPGYRAWLQQRGLDSPSNQQNVAVFDTGYDDGSTDSHHPDLAGRFVDGLSLFEEGFHDGHGHGTMVAGIIAGIGTGTGAQDVKDNTGGYLHGLGIAPRAGLVPVKIQDCSTVRTSRHELEPGFIFSRSHADGSDKALISNHSWNRGGSDYNELSSFFDEMALDANPDLVGEQPMTLVVSAGNGGAHCNGFPWESTVAEPATAKNVIAVGATLNDRPAVGDEQPPPGCGPSCFTLGAEDIEHLAYFSSKGAHFESWEIGDPPLDTPIYAHNVRIKPDLVAPGVRIVSTVPYETPSTFDCMGRLCESTLGFAAATFHSYAQGTSFSAPAVAGSAALLRKWFLDRSTDPSPSLIKATLIATADDLCQPHLHDPAPTLECIDNVGDHRPSNFHGWGRVNLDTLTDPAVARFWTNEEATLAVSSGQQRSFKVAVDDPAKDVYVVLVWSDKPSVAGSGSQTGLINDLRLTIDEADTNLFWRGNNFNENKSGLDDGYSHRFIFGSDPLLEDQINTVEAVFIPGGTFSTGKELSLRVAGANVSDGPQAFSLYAYNASRTNTPPVANDDFVDISCGIVTHRIEHEDLVANDLDAEDDPLAPCLTRLTDHGGLQWHFSSFEFIPEPPFWVYGEDSFDYRATDGPSCPGNSNEATVTLTADCHGPGQETFHDSFEGGDLTSWNGLWIPDGGALEVTQAAALSGTLGLEVVLDATATRLMLVRDFEFVDNHFNAAFLIDPNSLQMADGSEHTIFAGVEGRNHRYTVQVRMRFKDGEYQLILDTWDDAGAWTATPWITIYDAVQAVRVEWWAAEEPGTNDGGMRLSIDGTRIVADVPGLDNDEKVIGRVRLGALGVDPGTLGSFYLDAFRTWQGERSRPMISDETFEDGLLPWSTWTPNGGSVEVTTAAKIFGKYGLEVGMVAETTHAIALDESPDGEDRFETFLRFDPNSLPTEPGKTHIFFVMAEPSGQGWVAVLRLRRALSGETLEMHAIGWLNGDTQVGTPWVPISDAPHTLRLQWKGATDAVSDGHLRFWIDGQLAGELTGMANSDKRVHRVWLGEGSGSAEGTIGSFYYDDFRAWR